MSYQLEVDSYPFDLCVKNYDNFHMLTFSVPQDCAFKSALLFWLRNGMIWYYAFNHEEAVECFRRALKICPSCAMAHWGISISHGQNYNSISMTRNDFPSAITAYDHAIIAKELRSDVSIASELSSVELALIDALQVRYNLITDENDMGPFYQNTELYEKALQVVYELYPNNICVGCMYAEALLNYSPWRLWNLDTGKPTAQYVVTARTLIEQGLAAAPRHPGLNHFYIHLMEMSPTPELALPSCSVLHCPHNPLIKHAGHLIHMPSHIYVLTGQWNEAIASNLQGMEADNLYVKYAGIDNCYTGYRLHNMHFVAYGATFAGHYRVGMDASQAIKNTLPLTILTNPALAPYFESFYSIDVHVMIRFGKWTEILALEVPTDAQIWPYTIAITRYAKGIASAILGDVTRARKELALFKEDCPLVSEMSMLHNNQCVKLLPIGEAMLEGEINYREGNYDQAFQQLQKAIGLSDVLVYDEPWGWMQPPRHALGALLLEQGRYEESERLFRADMDKSSIGRCHPDNVWALSGLLGCLQMKVNVLTHGTGTKPSCCSHKPAEGAEVCAKEVQDIRNECADIEVKLNSIRSHPDYDCHISVACMCAKHQ